MRGPRGGNFYINKKGKKVYGNETVSPTRKTSKATVSRATKSLSGHAARFIHSEKQLLSLLRSKPVQPKIPAHALEPAPGFVNKLMGIRRVKPEYVNGPHGKAIDKFHKDRDLWLSKYNKLEKTSRENLSRLEWDQREKALDSVFGKNRVKGYETNSFMHAERERILQKRRR